MILDVLPNKKPQVNDYMHTTHTSANRRQHMTDEQARATTGPALTDLQRDRIAYARSDLNDARAANLTQMPPAALLLLVEKLRRRLDDTLRVVDEITATPPAKD